eukprot:TRINITY_DN18243_c0_g1_i1.p1 TRINITY_DN18243_c0_g1~~TRINITY_DN18243_c0_g1_i1.p1  ORF type:complete len:107 (+),score=19.77 TRINITY_DN18243_c0_g1_i1:69-389(+)
MCIRDRSVCQAFGSVVTRDKLVVKAAVKLCELINYSNCELYYDKVPKFFSVIEDCFFIGMPDEEITLVKKLARTEAINSINKANEITQAIKSVSYTHLTLPTICSV